MWPTTFDARLASWTFLREQCQYLPVEPALARINDWWFRAPWRPYYLHWDDQVAWPDPWQLLNDNVYCDLAKALGILYTLHLCNHRPEMEIRIYNDPSAMEQYNLVYIDKGKYGLNYVHDEVVNKTQLPNNLKLVAQLSATDLNLEKIK
jgi:hypothetical protein